MPRFMGLVRMEEGVGTPPPELFDAIEKNIGAAVAAGHFLDGQAGVHVLVGRESTMRSTW